MKPEQVEEVCKFLSTTSNKNLTYKFLSKKFNMPETDLSSIYNRQRWKSISSKYPSFAEIKTNRKLSDKDIEEICKYIKNNPNLSNTEIGRVFNLNRTYISDLKKMKYRKSITEKYFK